MNEITNRQDGQTSTVAIVQKIGKPDLRIFLQNRNKLEGFHYDKTSADGKLVSTFQPPRLPEAHDKLMPEKTAKAVVRELATALEPATYDQAKALAKLIVGRYAKRDLYDFNTFIFEVARLFGEAPADLALEAADMLRANKFLPNVGDISEVLEPLVRTRKWAKRCAEKHLAEHERRRNAKQQPTETPEERAAHAAKVREQYPEAFGAKSVGELVEGMVE